MKPERFDEMQISELRVAAHREQTLSQGGTRLHLFEGFLAQRSFVREDEIPGGINHESIGSAEVDTSNCLAQYVI